MDIFIVIAVLLSTVVGIAVLVYIEEKFTKPARRRAQQPLVGVVAPKKTEDAYGPIPTDKKTVSRKKTK